MVCFIADNRNINPLTPIGIKFMIMKKKASELIFISKIKSDGSGVSRVFKRELHLLNNDPRKEEFNLTRLSISEDTYIASGFNSYVVKLK